MNLDILFTLSSEVGVMSKLFSFTGINMPGFAATVAAPITVLVRTYLFSKIAKTSISEFAQSSRTPSLHNTLHISNYSSSILRVSGWKSV